MENEEPVSPPADERLAAAMPDPSGSPQAVEANDPVLRAIATLGIGAVVLGGLTLWALSGTGATAGATRSARLQWEQANQSHRPPVEQRADESRPHD